MSKKLEGEIFASILTKRPRFYTDPGSREADDFEIQIDKKGHKVLKHVGTHDIYEEIQSYADECRIENIIARAAAGDMSVLNQRQGYYADITDAPTSLAEAQNTILKLEQEFYKLPAEVRAKFDNSKEVFIQNFGTDEFNEIMGWKQTESTDNKAEEVEFVPGTKETAKPLTPEGE